LGIYSKFQQPNGCPLIIYALNCHQLNCLLYDRTDPPTLPFTQGATFFDHYPVTYIADIAWIVSHITGPAPDELSIELMTHAPFNLDHNTFVHFITDHGTDSCLSCYFRITHLSLSINLYIKPGFHISGKTSSYFWFLIVITRAISLRT
jgi:hypothetical protein